MEIYIYYYTRYCTVLYCSVHYKGEKGMIEHWARDREADDLIKVMWKEKEWIAQTREKYHFFISSWWYSFNKLGQEKFCKKPKQYTFFLDNLFARIIIHEVPTAPSKSSGMGPLSDDEGGGGGGSPIFRRLSRHKERESEWVWIERERRRRRNTCWQSCNGSW